MFRFTQHIRAGGRLAWLLLETFVDPERFRGNLLLGGELGSDGQNHRPRQAIQQLCGACHLSRCRNAGLHVQG
jgi:hypothetical protein